jgi:CheY-like chemotaxis protein
MQQDTGLGQNILVVDDNDPLRQLMRLALEAAGYHVTEARDGLEALQCLQESPVTVVISDNQMPRLDGLGLLAEIRKNGGSTPVILVSAGLRPEQVDEARAFGVHAVFHKPVDQDSLFETLQHLCESLPVATLS